MRILIAGSAGKIGSTLIRGMGARHKLRGLDRVPTASLDDQFVADITDSDAMLEAARDMDAIIHLANAGNGWENFQTNVAGTHNVLEAARQNGVRRVAYASRAGILAPYPKSIRRTVDMPPKPESFYTISKIVGENMGYMYSDVHGIGFVAVRIGSFVGDRPEPDHPHHLGHEDTVRVFERAVTHPDVTFEIVFGVSDSNWPLYDLDHGRNAIGYYPQQLANVPEDEWER